jgi:osmotically-inducible protein OsmY
MSRYRQLSVITLGALIAVLVGCAGSPTQQSAGEYIDDAAMTTRVKTAVFNEPSLRTVEISVETYDGVVQLSGFVGSQEEIQKAGEVARSVHGVRSVRNDLQLK